MAMRTACSRPFVVVHVHANASSAIRDTFAFALPMPSTFDKRVVKAVRFVITCLACTTAVLGVIMWDHWICMLAWRASCAVLRSPIVHTRKASAAGRGSLQWIFADSTDFHHQNATGGNLGKSVESNDSTTDPTSFRDLAESNDPTTRSHQIPQDPTVSHHIPPYPTNIMRLGVKFLFFMCLCVLAL
jgi:hypothetical protein